MLSFRLIILISTLLLTSCSTTSQEPPLNSGRVNLDFIQQNFRSHILLQFQETERPSLEILAPLAPEQNLNVSNDPTLELKTWRAEISKSWNEIPSDKFYLVCQILYEGIFDAEATFGKFFTEVRDQFQQDGITVHSLTDVTLSADNRESIQFPTSEYSSSLFVCSSQISLKLYNGNILPPQKSTLAWNYYFSDGKIKSTVSFKMGN